MKIYFNRKPVAGPWGGGSKILRACVDAFKRAGHTVVFQLEDGIDILFCFDPRPGSESGLVDYRALYQYAHGRNAPVADGRPLIVQRVGDVGSHGKPELTELVVASSFNSDSVIFPSAWALSVVQQALEMHDVRPTRQWHVIPNAAMGIFYRSKTVAEMLPEHISFVTHHWSTNPSKGFAFYELFEKWCIENGHRFTFIGRKPEGSSLTTSGPLVEAELAEELTRHDVYVTASLAEAGANHVLEAMAVGLPVIYHRAGGSISEYCNDMGVPFDGTLASFESALTRLKVEYPKIKRSLRKNKQTIDDIAQQYVALVEGLRG